MRFADPETIKDRRMPTNFDSRPTYSRPNQYQNRQRPPHQSQPQGEKWQRGFEARPDFQKQKQNLDKDLDNYGTKSQKAGNGQKDGRDFDDWRKKRDGEWADDRRQGGRRSRSPMRREEQQVMRPSPPRGEDRRSEESDMVLDDD